MAGASAADDAAEEAGGGVEGVTEDVAVVGVGGLGGLDVGVGLDLGVCLDLSVGLLRRISI